MKKIILIITFVIFALSAQAAQDNIIAKVGKKIITIDDINKRLAMVMIVNNLPQNQDIAQEIAPKVLNMLIDEELFFIEAEKESILMLVLSLSESCFNPSKPSIFEENEFCNFESKVKFGLLKTISSSNVPLKTSKSWENFHPS